MVVIDETVMVLLSFIDEEENVKELKSKRQNEKREEEGEFGESDVRYPTNLRRFG